MSRAKSKKPPTVKVGSITVYLNVFQKENNQPCYRGKLSLDDTGETYDVALWINQECAGVPVNLSGQLTTVSGLYDDV